MKSIPILLALLGTCTAARLPKLHRRANPLIQPRQSEQYTDSNGVPLPQTVTLKLDHYSSNDATFDNRYWVYDAAYKPGGPVIISDVGESNAEDYVETLYSDISVGIANATQGLVILWEHRYYGHSYPVQDNLDPDDPDSIGEWFKYHTVEQALEDFVEFAHGFKYKDEEVSPGKVPWIFTGGSYPGARAAWLRMRNPEIVFASFASSAVVEVTAELPEYAVVVFNYFKENGYAGCMQDLKALVDWMSEVVDDSDARNYNAFMELVWGSFGSVIQQNYFSQNSGSGTWDQAKANLASLMNYVFKDYQYGRNATTIQFCDSIASKVSSSSRSSDLETVSSDPDSGVVATLGLSDGLAVMGEAFNEILVTMEKTRLEEQSEFEYSDFDNWFDDVDNSTTTDNSAWDSMSWTYQTCREMGYFFTDDKQADTPKFVNLAYSIDDCVDMFGKSVANGPSLAPQKKYGGMKKVNPSNTFWVDGQWDPWRPATPNADDSGRKASSKIPEAGKTLPGNEFFGVVIPNAFHVPLGSCTLPEVEEGDFDVQKPSGDESLPCSKDIVDTQQLFLDALEKWLPKFKEHATPRKEPSEIEDGETSGVGRVGGNVVMGALVAGVVAMVVGF